MKHSEGEHLESYIEGLVKEGERKKCRVKNLKANNTERSVRFSMNKKLMCSILIGANKNDRQKEKTADFTLLYQLPPFLPKVCKLVVLRKLEINGICLGILLNSTFTVAIGFHPKLCCT